MAYFPDLGTTTAIDEGEYVRAVGWLSLTQAFTRGDVSREFRERLRMLCSSWTAGLNPLGWPVAAGFHGCEFCDSFYSSGNIGIPAGGMLYVAPEMVAHYVEVHGYRPPDGFIEAVLQCPPLDSDDYARAVAPFRGLGIDRRCRVTEPFP